MAGDSDPRDSDAPQDLDAIEYWIQLENRPWDVSPHNIDRMTGQNMQAITGHPPAAVTMKSFVLGTPDRTVMMNNPLREGNDVIDALILRRYRRPMQPGDGDAWTVPLDCKINPWDLNEHNPGDSGTMGTIPGPVIECSVGDRVRVHFRNADGRPGKPILTRTHSLHPHGFVFRATSDGAYPLTPPDPDQEIEETEAAAWKSVGVTGRFKQGDRVPPGGTFTYTWETVGWPSTAGVWLYHDHSVCDMENVELGAIGLIVIHNDSDPANEVDIRLPLSPDRQPGPRDPRPPDPALLPGGSPNGSSTTIRCFPFREDPPSILSGLLSQLGLPPDHLHSAGPEPEHDEGEPGNDDEGGQDPESDPPAAASSLKLGPAVLEVDEDQGVLRRFCLPVYRTPPSRMLILQLYHTMKNAGMCINGRRFLGNTPTTIAGRETKMRFGVVGMGNDAHTFHLHGHRWILPGPDGNDPGTIQSSPQHHPVSQFEDTRILGPANSLVFTIDGQPGSFMRAGGRELDASLGEWHMHCHVLGHMMTGMMGSLLIIRGGEFAYGLASGVPCPAHVGAPVDHGTDHGTGTKNGGPVVHLTVNDKFSPEEQHVNAGDTVTWKWDDNDLHSIVSDDGPTWCEEKSGGPPFPEFSRAFDRPGTYRYHCGIHGTDMSGKIIVT